MGTLARHTLDIGRRVLSIIDESENRKVSSAFPLGEGRILIPHLYPPDFFGFANAMRQPDELDSQWTGWMSASATHNYANRDPDVDFLNSYGKQLGFMPDQERPGHEPRSAAEPPRQFPRRRKLASAASA